MALTRLPLHITTLQTMPIIVETPSQIRRKNELETRLREIEDAFKVFSRPKVLVHL